MKKILLLILATAILFSMSSIFVYADFAAGAPEQSYDFEDKEDTSMFAKTSNANIKTKLHSAAGVGNSSANMLRIQSGASTAGYARFIALSTPYNNTNNLFEFEAKLLKNIPANAEAKIVFSRYSKVDTYSTTYGAGALVFTNSTIEWLPGDDQTYKFAANISDLSIADDEWFNIKILGNAGVEKSYGSIKILINNSLISLTASNNISNYAKDVSYNIFPMKKEERTDGAISFNIQFLDTTQNGYLDIDDIKTGIGDGSVKLKDIEAQTLDINEVKSIDLNDYFLAYDSSEITYSIDEEFGTIENGVLTFNTSSAVSDTATLTAGNKTSAFNFTVKNIIDDITVATAENTFSSNDNETITIDGKIYNRYAMIFAKVPTVSGYELQEYGVLLMENTENKVPYITSENVVKGVADKTKTTNDGAYGVLFEGTGIKSGVEYYLRPYAIYVDSEGNKINKYGSSKKFTLNN